MDFHSMKRKQLQALCKTHGVPANLKNHEMADRLSSLLKEKEGQSSEKEAEEVASGFSLKRVSRNTKKVKFSPEEDEVFVYEPTVRRNTRGYGRKSRRQSVVKFASDLSDMVSPPVVEGRKGSKGVGESGDCGGRGGRLQRRLKRNAVNHEELLKQDGEVVEEKGQPRKSRRLSVAKSASENTAVLLPPRGARNKVMDVIEETEEERNAAKDEGSLNQNGQVLEVKTNVRKSRRQSRMKSASDESTVLLPPSGGRNNTAEVIEDAGDGAGQEGRLRRLSKRKVAEVGRSSKQITQDLKEEIVVRKSSRQSRMKSASEKPTVLSSSPGGRKQATEVIEEVKNGAGRGGLRRVSKRNVAEDEGSLKQHEQAQEEETNVRRSRRQAVKKSASEKPLILLPQSGRMKITKESTEKTGNAAGQKEGTQRPSNFNFAEDDGSLKQNGQVPKEETKMRKSTRQTVIKSASHEPTPPLPQPGRSKRAMELVKETGNNAPQKERIQRPPKRDSAKDKESVKQNEKVLEGDTNVNENPARKSRSRKRKDTDSVKMDSTTSDIGKDTRKGRRHGAAAEEDEHSGIADDIVQSKDGNGPTAAETVLIEQPSPTAIAVFKPTDFKVDPVLNSSKEDLEQSNMKVESEIASDVFERQTSVEVPTVSTNIQQVVAVIENVEISISEKLYDVPRHLGEVNFDVDSNEKPKDISLGSERDDSFEGAICSGDMDDDNTNLLDAQANISQDDPVADVLSSINQFDNAGEMDSPLNSENELEDKESLEDNLTRTKQLDLHDKVPSSEALLKNETLTRTAEIAASEPSELKLLDSTCDYTNNLGKSVKLSAVDIDVEEAKNNAETHVETPFPEFLNDISHIWKEGNSDMKSSTKNTDDILLISEKEDSSMEVICSDDSDDDTDNLLYEHDHTTRDDPVVDGLPYSDRLENAGALGNPLNLENELGEESLTGVGSLSESDDFIKMKQLVLQDEVPSRGTLLSSAVPTLNAGVVKSELLELRLDQAFDCSNKDVQESNDKMSQLSSLELCFVDSDAEEATDIIETHEGTLLPVNAHDISSNQKEGSESSVEATKASLLSFDKKNSKHSSFDAAGIDDLAHYLSNTEGGAIQGDLLANNLLSIDQSSSGGNREPDNPSDFEKKLIVEEQLGLPESDVISRSAAQVFKMNSILCKDDVRSTSEFEESYCIDRRDSYAIGTSPIIPFALPQNQVYCPSEKELPCIVLALPKTIHDPGQEAYHFEEQFTSKSSSGKSIKKQDDLLEQTHSWEALGVDHAGALTEIVKDALKEVIPSECSHDGLLINCDSLLEKNNRWHEETPTEKTLSNNEDTEDILKEVMSSKNCSIFLGETNNQIVQDGTAIDRVYFNHDEIEDAFKEVRASESTYKGLFRSYEAFLEETYNQAEEGIDEGIQLPEKHSLNVEGVETAMKKVMTAESIYDSPVKSSDALPEATNDQDNVQVERRETSDIEINECHVERQDALMEDINYNDEVEVAQVGASREMPALSDMDIEDTLKEVSTKEVSSLSASVESRGGMNSNAVDGNEIQEFIERTSMNFPNCFHHDVENLEGRMSSKLLVQISDNVVCSSAVDSCRESDPPEITPITIGKGISMNILEEDGEDTASVLQVSSPSLNQQFVDSGAVPATDLMSDVDKSCPKKLDGMSTDGEDTKGEETAECEEENLNIMDEVSEAKECLLTEPLEENLAEEPENERNASSFDNILDPKFVDIAVESDGRENHADASTCHDDGSETLSMLHLQSDALQVRISRSPREENEFPNTEQVPFKMMELKRERGRLLSKTPHKLFSHHDMKENSTNLKSPKFATATKILSKRQPLGDLPNK